MGTHYFREKALLDVGAGSGSFIDHVKGLTKRVMAIEPNSAMRRILRERAIIVFSGMPFEVRYDVITSFLVIEHVLAPCKHIEECFNLLNNGGQMWIQTPLYHDKVNQPYFFRTQHRWYFTEESLTNTIMHCEFKPKDLRTFTMKRSHMDEEDIWAVITK